MLFVDRKQYAALLISNLGSITILWLRVGMVKKEYRVPWMGPCEARRTTY